MKKILVSKDSKLKIDSNRKYIVSIGLKLGSNFNSLSYCSSELGDSFSKNIEDSYVYTLSEIGKVQENFKVLVDKIGVALDNCEFQVFEVFKKIYFYENSNTFKTKKYSEIETPEFEEISFTTYSQDIESDYIDIEQFIADQNSFSRSFGNFKSKIFDMLEKEFDNKPLINNSDLKLFFSDPIIKFSIEFKGLNTIFKDGYFQTNYDCLEFKYNSPESYNEWFEDLEIKMKKERFMEKEKFKDFNFTFVSLIDEFKWTLTNLLVDFPNLNLVVLRS